MIASRLPSKDAMLIGDVPRPAIRVVQLTWERDCRPAYLYREPAL